MKKDLLNSPTDGSMQGSGAMPQYIVPAAYNENTYNPHIYLSAAKKNCGCNDRQNAVTGANSLNNNSDMQQIEYGNNTPYPQSAPYNTQAPYQQSEAQLPFSSLPQSVLPAAKIQAMSAAGVGAAPMWQQLAQESLYPKNQ